PGVTSPVPGETPPPPTDNAGVTDETTPAEEAMNGAQVAALQGLVVAVSNKEMPAKAALLVARAAFPTIPEADLTAMFGAADAFEPAKPEPTNTVLPVKGTKNDGTESESEPG